MTTSVPRGGRVRDSANLVEASLCQKQTSQIECLGRSEARRYLTAVVATDSDFTPSLPSSENQSTRRKVRATTLITMVSLTPMKSIPAPAKARSEHQCFRICKRVSNAELAFSWNEAIKMMLRTLIPSKKNRTPYGSSKVCEDLLPRPPGSGNTEVGTGQA
eukprot:3888766-Rhodomonas_salina.2